MATPVARLQMLGQGLRGWLVASMSSANRRRPAATSDEQDADDARRADEECRRSLRSVLEMQIIPRLVLAQRARGEVALARSGQSLAAGRLAAFATCCSAGDRAGAKRIVDELMKEGLDQEAVFVDLIGPAARYLGQQWEEDYADFSEVTVGLVLMHELIHGMGYEYHDGPQLAGGVKRVMLASAPGSQHVLGLSIVSEIFRKAGWQVVLEVSPSAAELCRAVGNEWFDMIGLSIALDAQLDSVGDLVQRMRAASINPQTPVLLGGPVFTRHSLEPQQFGAQAICVDAREAVRLALATLPT